MSSSVNNLRQRSVSDPTSLCEALSHRTSVDATFSIAQKILRTDSAPSCFSLLTAKITEPQSSYRSGLRETLGQDQYVKLLENCAAWSDLWFELVDNDEENLDPFVKNESFQEICRIHDQLKAGDKSEKLEPFIFEVMQNRGLAPFFMELLFQQHVEFIIPYVYLTNSVPTDFSGVSLGALGYPDKLPKLIRAFKQKNETSF